MNKKGFTLVELLAVIAILAILVIIALPNVLSMFNSAKQSAFETQVKEIARTAEKEWLKDSIKSSGAKVYSKCSDGTCTNPLDMNASDNLEYYVHMDSSGKIDQLYVKDDSFQYGKNGEFDINNVTGIEKVSDVNDNNKIAIENGVVKIGGNVVSEGSGGNPSTPSITFTNRSNPNNVTQDDEIELPDLGTFRVLSADASTALLFPKYNLNIGSNSDTSKIEFAQAASIKGSTGQIAFSDSNYWNGKVGTTYPGNTGSSPLAYVVDSNCNLYDYIIRYQTTIRNKGLTGATVRLMKFEEANSFISSENSYMCNATFWLGSAKWGSIYILEKTNSACELKYVAFNNGEGRGFRPVVEVPISTLLN